jgi:hypothetical protein
MTRVNLDELERQLEGRGGASTFDVLDVVTELRAAREVVKVARSLYKPPSQLDSALVAYDQAVGLVGGQVAACDRCTQGVMDADQPGQPGNDHLYGRCTCDCHEVPA